MHLVSVYRGGLLESFHTGSIAVVDAQGRLVAYAGDPAESCYLRSSAKPFQAISVLKEGASDEYDLSGEELALICASHGGEPHHIATAAALLRKGEFDESDLLCGAHAPFDEKAAAELRASGEPPSVLHNNCSGKHAGMLLASRLMDAATAEYTSLDHPVQQQNHRVLAEFAGLEVDEIAAGIDGCSVPSFYLSLYRTAYAFARFAATSSDAGSTGALPRYSDEAREIFDAMTGFPEYVAGAWSMTTPLMQSFPRQLLGKEGAEGLYTMAIRPELTAGMNDRLSLQPGAALGIALKIHDGSMGRGRNPAILRTLEQLGLDVAGRLHLAPYRERTLRNVAGLTVGEVKADFELEIL